MHKPMSFKEWKDEYKHVLRRGLSDGTPKYVRLVRKKMPNLTVDLALLPVALTAPGDTMTVFFNKLSVFPVEGSLESVPLNPAVLVGWMEAAFPSIEFDKRSVERVGTTMVAALKAPTEEQCAILAMTLVSQLEACGEFETSDRDLVISAIRDAYVGCIWGLHNGAPKAEVLPFSGAFKDSPSDE